MPRAGSGLSPRCCSPPAFLRWLSAALAHAGDLHHGAGNADRSRASVTASGTVNPQNLISVGTQVSGTIASIAVDYNSKVKRGQVLARLDPSTFRAQLDQANAAVAQARAQVAQAAASANGAASGIGAASADKRRRTRRRCIGKNERRQKTQAALCSRGKRKRATSSLLSQGYVAQNTVDTDRANVVEDSSRRCCGAGGRRPSAGARCCGEPPHDRRK